MSSAKSVPIGTTSCIACGAKVTVRYSATRERAFWTCKAELEGRACGSRLVLGPRPTRELRAPTQGTASAAEPNALTRKSEITELRRRGPWAALGLDFG